MVLPEFPLLFIQLPLERDPLVTEILVFPFPPFRPRPRLTVYSVLGLRLSRVNTVLPLLANKALSLHTTGSRTPDSPKDWENSVNEIFPSHKFSAKVVLLLPGERKPSTVKDHPVSVEASVARKLIVSLLLLPEIWFP